MSDEIERLRVDSEHVRDTARAWMAAHPSEKGSGMKIALMAANGLPVTAEGGGDDVGLVVANRLGPGVGVWETWTVHLNDDGTISLQSNRDDGTWGRFLSAEGAGGGELHCNRAFPDDPDPTIPNHLRTAIGPWEKFRIIGDLKHAASIALETWDGAHYVCAEIETPDAPLNATRTAPLSWETFVVQVLEGAVRPVGARRGIIRAVGKTVLDDDGFFHPLGLTFFWGPYGWKFERERVIAHLDWLAPYRFDYLRILCEVNWSGRSIDPDWPDYEEQLGGFIDAAYERGMRCELTIIGGKPRDPMDLTEKVIRVVENDRHQKVAHFECTNEWQRLDKADLPTMQAIARKIKSRLPHLVALSQPGHSPDGKSWEDMERWTKACGADMFLEHTDRGTGDNRWRMVRQGYDFKNTKLPASSNEGPGPQSSVASLDNPLQLTLYRFTCVQMGAAFFVLHVGQGVTGKANPAHGRPENMWEVPEIDTILKGVRAIDALLPEGIENWRATNNWWNTPLPPHPMPTDTFWEGNHPDHGVNKNYAALGPEGRWVMGLLGVKNHTTAKARNSCEVQAFDPLSLEVKDTKRLAAGESWTLTGRADTMTGYVVVGKNL